jgi:ribosomal protein S19
MSNIVKSNKYLTVEDIGSTLKVYNGRKWFTFIVTENMCLHFLGEFILTKKLGGSIHKLKNKKKSNLKKK